ncbi:MAG: hypothetical protein WCA00_04665 [Candidatus Acidiferrales bacterium]
MAMETLMALLSDGEPKDPPRKRLSFAKQNRDPASGHGGSSVDTGDGRDLPASSSDISARGHGHRHTISLKLHDMSQLFNSMDPSPFIEKDLDDKAEEFIVSWAQEFPPKAQVRLRIYLDQWPAEDPKELIAEAVHNHFAHRAKITDLEFRRLLRQGRTSLFIGLLFLSACLVLGKLLGGEAGTWAAVARESLTIAGWVAMWRPMQIYLYDWWPLRRRSRTYAKLSHMPVQILQKGNV